MRKNIAALLAMATLSDPTLHDNDLKLINHMPTYPDVDLSHLKENKPNRTSKIAKRRSISVEVRTEPKIGRNEPCPCGSGIKYKKCCINGNK